MATRERRGRERESVIPRFFFRNFSGSNGGSQLDAMPLARERAFLLRGWREPSPFPFSLGRGCSGVRNEIYEGPLFRHLKGRWRRGGSLDLSLSNLLISPYFGTMVDDASRSAPWKRDHALECAPFLPFLLKTVPWANRTSRACHEKKFNVAHKSPRAFLWSC